MPWPQGYCQRLLVALIGCILLSNGCRLLSVKGRMLLSKEVTVSGLGYSALAMLLGTSLSGEKVIAKDGKSCDCSNE